MAITIRQQPTGLVSAFNHIDFLIDTNNTDPIFNYQIRPISGGQTIGQFLKPKSINGGKCHFDSQRVIQNLVSYDISGIVNNTTGIYKAANVFKEFYIQFAELSGATSTTVASGSPINSNTLVAVNSAFEYQDTFYTNYLSDYVIDGLPEKRFLTMMRGEEIRIGENDLFELGMMQLKSNTNLSKIQIKTYDSTNTLLGTYIINNSFTNTSNTDEQFLSIQVGTDSLNSQTLSSGVQPIITSSVETYTIQSLDGSNVATSELLTFRIDRDCYRFTPVRLFWLNKLGRFDSFNFNFANEKSIEVAKDYYQKQGGVISGNSFIRSSYETGDTTFNTRVDTSIKLRTDYISTKESEWLSELVKSPLIFMFQNSRLYAVKVNNTQYTNKDTRKDGMFIEEIDVQFTNSSFRQRL